MSEIIHKKKWVGGIVDVNQQVSNQPYTWFELDTVDESVHQKALSVYSKWGIDLVEHRIGKGYHLFGNKVDRSIWAEWYAELKPLNPKYPPLTLRVTRKFEGEVFERPVYHEAQNITPNWSKALMHFLEKERKHLNSTDIVKAMRDCGLHKYWKCVIYPIEQVVGVT